MPVIDVESHPMRLRERIAWICAGGLCTGFVTMVSVFVALTAVGVRDHEQRIAVLERECAASTP